MTMEKKNNNNKKKLLGDHYYYFISLISKDTTVYNAANKCQRWESKRQWKFGQYW